METAPKPASIRDLQQSIEIAVNEWEAPWGGWEAKPGWAGEAITTMRVAPNQTG